MLHFLKPGLVIAVLLAVAQSPTPPDSVPPKAAPKPQLQAPIATGFQLPCSGYESGLQGGSDFGEYIDPKRSKSVFAGSFRLAEDVWLPAKTKVVSAANGRVVYSDFIPSWTDKQGVLHRNFGNLIVVEHELPMVKQKRRWVCSVYAHLSADRRARVGDRVRKGQLIGFIGDDQSEENGLYPEHLSFGLHQGPYVQISPSWKADLIAEAQATGLSCDDANELVRGPILLTMKPNANVQIDFTESGHKTMRSLLVSSNVPHFKPMEIAAWCQTHGKKQAVHEWLRPSTWVPGHKSFK